MANDRADVRPLAELAGGVVRQVGDLDAHTFDVALATTRFIRHAIHSWFLDISEVKFVFRIDQFC